MAIDTYIATCPNLWRLKKKFRQWKPGDTFTAYPQEIAAAGLTDADVEVRGTFMKPGVVSDLADPKAATKTE
jgi:hypothetical protein